jgi:beta-galactosidase
MAALSMQAVGRGADGVLFFQWRQAASGSEKFHSAMLPHAGPETRTYAEVERLGAELAALGDLPAPGGEARVAIILDWDTWWALDQDNHPPRFDYLAQVQGWHTAFHEINVQVDFVRATGGFDGYHLIVAPSLYLLRDAGPLIAYARGGGHLLATAFTDVVDEHDRFLPGGFTQRLGPTLGLSVVDFDAAVPGEVTVRWDDVVFDGDVFAEVLRLDGAEVLATFGDGAPALTRHGRAYYLATLADAAGKSALARHLVERAGIAPVVAGLPARVEACARGGLVTLINHNPFPVTVDGDTLEPYGYLIRRP